MQRTPRKEEIVSVHLADGLLLAHYKEGRSRVCEDVSRLLGAKQSDPYPPTKLAKYDYPMTLPHGRARFGGTSQPAFKRVYLDLGGYRILHQVGKGHTTS